MGDVARHAGVSPATVARVLYNAGTVSAEKKQRIEAALEATGYRPNIVARGLRTQRSWTIGMIVVDGTINPFFTHLTQAVRTEALDRGYNVLVYNHGMSAKREADAVSNLIQQRADAVIFSYGVAAENMAPLVEAGIPIVQVERDLTLTTHSVLIDPVPGISEAINHLVELGHQRIAYIGGDPKLYPRPRPHGSTMEEDRLRAYQSAMEANGLRVSDGMIQLGLYFSPAGNPITDEGRKLTHQLMAQKDRPTAILASGDTLAAGTLQELSQMGIAVPQDVSVIGFDNSIADLLTPPLSSIGRPLQEMGIAALDLAISAISDVAMKKETIRFPTKLIIRRSTGPLAKT
ncbi:LacI family transcriptional regulator [Neorhizobium galegae]|nr:LacI family transcriptional regulator [Neorhizobium galegae]